MRTIKTIKELRAWRATQGRVAFVPTMGNLHDGHLALVREAKRQADSVVVSIFVNRLQFGQGEDFDAYPRTLEKDAAKLIDAGVAVLFAPDETELYPQGTQFYNVEPPAIQNDLCGKARPGHFRGVATVVMKLFHIVTPNVACFGKKDYQQWVMIRDMVKDLNLDIDIVGVDIGRAADGLALSSRNAYLSPEERQKAPELYQEIQRIVAAIVAGDRHFGALETAATMRLQQAGWSVDYVAIRRADHLHAARAEDEHLVVLAAARLGKTRLIDNCQVKVPQIA